ncbi:MAG: TRAP transporter large permease [Pirellulales bacterium]|nr:TRAP transporter large permease [Pirellulales bacterium]
MMSLLTIGIAVVLAAVGVPLLFAIAMGCIIAILATGDTSLLIVVQRMFYSGNLYPIVAVPLFMLAGEVMNRGGLSRRIIRFSDCLMGHIPGSAGLTTTMASMLFAAISGSSAATAAAVGTIMIPSMIRNRFKPAFATAVLAFSSSLGIVVPPSITLIIYGALAGVSISQLFLASIVPGILAGLALMLVSYHQARKEKIDVEPSAGWAASAGALRSAFWAILMPVVILGGIFSGFFTPTEAAAVAVFYGLFVGLCVHRELRWGEIYPMFARSALNSSVPVLLFCVGGLLNHIFSIDRLPERLAEGTLSVTSSQIVFLLVVNIFLFVLGMFMESSALLVVLTPVLAPLAQSFGIDLVHFGVLMNLNISIGQASPPIGSTLFIGCTVSKVDIGRMFRPSLPFLVASWAVLLLVSYAPLLWKAVVSMFS